MRINQNRRLNSTCLRINLVLPCSFVQNQYVRNAVFLSAVVYPLNKPARYHELTVLANLAS
jgi:hypothetical protein